MASPRDKISVFISQSSKACRNLIISPSKFVFLNYISLIHCSSWQISMRYLLQAKHFSRTWQGIIKSIIMNLKKTRDKFWSYEAWSELWLQFNMKQHEESTEKSLREASLFARSRTLKDLHFHNRTFTKSRSPYGNMGILCSSCTASFFRQQRREVHSSSRFK